MRQIKPSLSRPSLARWLLLASADTWVIAHQRPQPGRLWRQLRQPHRWVIEAGADHAMATLAGAALWLAAIWLGLSLVACLSVRLPGPIGQAARQATALAVPRMVQRMVLGGAAMSIVLTPANAGATPGSDSCDGGHLAVSSPTSLASQPAIPWPSGDDGAVRRTPPAQAAGSAHAAGSARPATSATGYVTIQPGDSLWLIARRHTVRHSAAETAAAWPRWYQANRRVIGDDPGLLRPGVRLSPPKRGS